MDAFVIQSPINKIKGQAAIKISGSKWHLTHPPGNQSQPASNPKTVCSKNSGPSPSTSCPFENGIVANGSHSGKKGKSKRFYSFRLLSSHVVYRKQKKLFKCDVCQLLYRHVFSLKRHFLRNHVSIRYVSKSDINNCKINVKNRLGEIADSDSDEKSSASSTNSTYASKQLSSHVTSSEDQNATMPGLFRCHLCKDLNFDTLSEIQNHFKNHMNASELRFPCEKCNVIFSSKQALYRHLASHSEPTSFPCTTCGKIFDSKSSYLKHAATHTDNRTCKYCRKVLSTKANRSRHERIHEGLKPYPCKHCTFQFSQSGDLKRHVKKEHAALYIACTICSSLFSSKTALNKHMVDKHGKHNTSKSVIQSPVQVNAKPPVQSTSTPKTGCSQGSSEKQPLQSVQERRMEPKTYHCPVCKKPYRSYISMLQHRRHNHPVSSAPRRVHKRTKYYTRSMRQKLYPKPSNFEISEEEFYRTLPSAIANNLCNYIDGRTSHLSLTQYNFSEPMENCSVRPPQHWSTYNFPNNFDVEHALHSMGHEIKNHISETNISFPDTGLVNDLSSRYSNDSTDYAYFDLEPTDSDLAIYPEGVYIDYKNINVEERKKLLGKVIKSVIMCCVCKEKLPSYQAYEDHSSNNHPNVQCTYVEIEGDKDVVPVIPDDMQRQFLSPAGVYFEYDVPPPVSEARVISCTKCQATFSSAPELHQHIISCGGGKEVTALHVRRTITQRKIKRTMKKRMDVSSKTSLFRRNASITHTPVSVTKHSEVTKENHKSGKPNNQLNVKPSVGRPKSNSCVLCPHCKQNFRTKTLLNSHVNRCYKRVVMKNKSLKVTQKKLDVSKPGVVKDSEVTKPSEKEAFQESQLEKLSVPLQDNQIQIPSPINSPVERLSPSLEVLINSIREKITSEELSPSNPTFSWMEDEHFIVAPNTSQPSIIANASMNLQMKDPNISSVVSKMNKVNSVTSAVANIDATSVNCVNSRAPSVPSPTETSALNNKEENSNTEMANKVDLNIEDQKNEVKSDVPVEQVSVVCDQQEVKVEPSSRVSISVIKRRAAKSKIKSNPYVKRRKRRSKITKATGIVIENSTSNSEISVKSTASITVSQNDKISLAAATPKAETIVPKQVYGTQDTLPVFGDSFIPDPEVPNSAVEPPGCVELPVVSTGAAVCEKSSMPSTRAAVTNSRNSSLPPASAATREFSLPSMKRESPLPTTTAVPPLPVTSATSVDSPLPTSSTTTKQLSLSSSRAAASRKLPLSTSAPATRKSSLPLVSAAAPKELPCASSSTAATTSKESVNATTSPKESILPSVSAAVAPKEVVLPLISAAATTLKNLSLPSTGSRGSEIVHARFPEKKVQEHSDVAKNSSKEKHKCPYCMVDFAYLSTFHNHISACQEKHVKKEQDESQQRNSLRALAKKDLIEESMISLLRHQSRQTKMMKEAKTDDSSDVKNFQSYTCDNCHKIFLSLFKLLQHRVEHKLQNSDEPSASLSNSSASNIYNTSPSLSQSAAMPMLQISTSSSLASVDSPGPSSAPPYLLLSQSAAESHHFSSTKPLSVKIPNTSSTTLQNSGPLSAPVRLQNMKIPSFSTAIAATSPILRSSSVGSQLEHQRSSSVGSQLEHQRSSSPSTAKLDISIKSTPSRTHNILEECEKESADELVLTKLDFVFNKPSKTHSSTSISGQKVAQQQINSLLPKRRKKCKKLILRKHAQTNKKQIKKKEKSSLENCEVPHSTDSKTPDTQEKVETPTLASSSEEKTLLEVSPTFPKTPLKSKKSTSDCVVDKSCPLCGKVFYSLNYKNRHMLLKHNDQSSEARNVTLHVNKVKNLAKKKIGKRKLKRNVLQRECKKPLLPKRSIVKKSLLLPRQRK